MPSLFLHPSPFLSFILPLSLLSWQRTRSKDTHHFIAHSSKQMQKVLHFDSILIFCSRVPSRFLETNVWTAQLDGITMSAQMRKQINRLHFVPPILALFHSADVSWSKNNELIIKSALTMESRQCGLIYIDLFVGFVK